MVTPPPLAVTVRLKAPADVPEAAFRVSVLLPFPGEAMLAGIKLAVTSGGKPLTDSAIADLNPFTVAVVIFTVLEPPGATVTLAVFDASVKLGVNTVRLSG